MGNPIFFQQARPGYKDNIFTLYKFRTMNNDCDENGVFLSDTERLTKLGRIIRSLSIDEFPQLLNVIKGEMSIVGPRPLLVKYLGRYSAKHAQRHNVKPGITGWAQIHGRNNASFSSRLDMDIWYIENYSFILDLKIIYLTILRVIDRKGTSIHKDVLVIDDVNITDASRRINQSI